jgi:hypothetical protein
LIAEDFVSLRQEIAVVSFTLEETLGVAAVQFQHSRDNVLKKVTVVADDQIR